jgi:cell division septum initiation protein DivIVA
MVKATWHMEISGVVGALVLLLAFALAEAAVAGAQSKDEQKPGLLWNTYPLDPSGDQAAILGRPQTESQSRSNAQPAAAGSPPAAAGFPAPLASSAPSHRRGWNGIFFLIAMLLAGLATMLVAHRNRPGRSVRRRATDASPAAESKTSRAKRSPKEALPVQPNPTKEGSSMVNFRRNPDDDEAGVEPEPHAAASDPPEPDSGEEEDRPVLPLEHSETDAVSSDEKVPAFASFGEELQTVLVSAQEAAAKIRRRADEEAERIRNEAAAAADAERGEAERLAEASRADAERLRSEADAYAHETRITADGAAAQRRSEVEAEVGRILGEAQRRRYAIEAELADRVEHAEEEARKRIGTLQIEIQRQEERLESIAVVLQSMTSEVGGLLDRRGRSVDLSDDLANLTGKAVEES